MRGRRKGVSFGTVFMLMMTVLVVAGFGYLVPRLTGTADIRIDARELFVAMDSTVRELGAPLGQGYATQPPQSATPAPILINPTEEPVLVTPRVDYSFTFTAGGAINIDTAVQKTMAGNGGYDFSKLLGGVKGELTGDLCLATLENTVIAEEKTSSVNIPVSALTALRQCGVNALCMGFEGALSGGVAGVAATIDAMKAAQIVPYGVYPTQNARNRLTLTQVKDVTVALLSYQDNLDSQSKRATSAEEQGFAVLQPTLPTITQDITSARAMGAQVVVVSLCWGKQNASAPTDSQRQLAQGIADAGADIIIGTHSQVLQTVELLSANRGDGGNHQTLCAYSLGNLLTSDREKRTRLASALLHATVRYDASTDTVSFEGLCYTPVYISRGKDASGKLVYRVLASDLPPPDDLDDKQRTVMKNCLELVTEKLADTPLTPRAPKTAAGFGVGE